MNSPFYLQSPSLFDAYRNSPFRINGSYQVAQAGKDWYYVRDAVDYNCLAFKSAPGVKFTDKESAELIADCWNRSNQAS